MEIRDFKEGILSQMGEECKAVLSEDDYKGFELVLKAMNVLERSINNLNNNDTVKCSLIANVGFQFKGVGTNFGGALLAGNDKLRLIHQCRTFSDGLEEIVKGDYRSIEDVFQADLENTYTQELVLTLIGTMVTHSSPKIVAKFISYLMTEMNAQGYDCLSLFGRFKPESDIEDSKLAKDTSVEFAEQFYEVIPQQVSTVICGKASRLASILNASVYESDDMKTILSIHNDSYDKQALVHQTLNENRIEEEEE